MLQIENLVTWFKLDRQTLLSSTTVSQCTQHLWFQGRCQEWVPPVPPCPLPLALVHNRPVALSPNHSPKGQAADEETTKQLVRRLCGVDERLHRRFGSVLEYAMP